MQSASMINMKNIDLNTVDRDALVDIRDVKVNTALPKRERAIDFIRQIGNPYCYKHGKYVVKVGFSDTEVSLEESPRRPQPSKAEPLLKNTRNIASLRHSPLRLQTMW